MKNLSQLVLLVLIITYSCKTSINKPLKSIERQTIKVGDTLTISDDKLEYDIIVIEPGFNAWLTSQARPRDYYSKSYLENKNKRYVIEWNLRVLNPNRFKSNLYEMQIDYSQFTDYGYELNYKLYNYFIFFQNRYKQNLLGGFVPIN